MAPSRGRRGEFENPAEALRALRARAQHAIEQGDVHGIDVRQHLIKLRDDAGQVLFNGTFAEAASLTLDDSAG